MSLQHCPVCNGHSFSCNKVLWEKLIIDWDLSLEEVAYINKQQGYHCLKCGCNLRSMALANAILKSYQFSGTLLDMSRSDFGQPLRILEINEAGGLSSILAKFPNHYLIRYPDYDMLNLCFQDGIFDLVVHSDTLEHVADPVVGLKECRRVLAEQGRCIYTVPIVVGRMSRSRTGLENSYHGSAEIGMSDFLVHTEFGADAWCFAAEAGFQKIITHSLDYPAGLAIEGSC